MRLMVQMKRHHYSKGLRHSLGQREKINESSYEEFSLPAWPPRPQFIPFSLLGLLTVPSAERLLSTQIWAGLNWSVEKMRAHSLSRMLRGAPQTWMGKGKWTERKLPADGLFLLYLLCSGFSPFIWFLCDIRQLREEGKRKQQLT